ncbi:phosphorelay sensor kinase [Aureococcus anophagefferens]|nr:phosphorelay sensor kinase [Aureococcus anophagefferens]
MSQWGMIDIMAILPLHLLNQKLRVMRLLKILRLAKLMKIVRASRTLAQIQQRMSVRFAFVSLIKYAVGSIFLMHWFDDLRWDHGHRRLSHNYGTHDAEEFSGRSLDDSDWRVYTQSFEFAVMTMVLGYGIAEPVTQIEQGYAIVCMICMGSFYAYMIASVCGIISVMDPAMTEFHNNMDLLNQFMKESKLPPETRNRCRDYFRFCKDHFTSKYYTRILLQLSPTIRGEFAEHFHGVWIRQISFFNCPNLEERGRFVIEVAVSLTLEGFARGEFVYHRGDPCLAMFIIRRGIAGCNGRVLRPGRFFGEDMIVTNLRMSSASVLSFLDVHRLSKDRLDKRVKMKFHKAFDTLLKGLRMKAGYARVTRAELEVWKVKREAALQQSWERMCSLRVRSVEEGMSARDRVDIDRRFGTSRPNFDILELGRVEVRDLLKVGDPEAIEKTYHVDRAARARLDQMLHEVSAAQKKLLETTGETVIANADFLQKTVDEKLNTMRDMLERLDENLDGMMEKFRGFEAELAEVKAAATPPAPNRTHDDFPADAPPHFVRAVPDDDESVFPDHDDVSVMPDTEPEPGLRPHL